MVMRWRLSSASQIYILHNAASELLIEWYAAALICTFQSNTLILCVYQYLLSHLFPQTAGLEQWVNGNDL